MIRSKKREARGHRQSRQLLSPKSSHRSYVYVMRHRGFLRRPSLPPPLSPTPRTRNNSTTPCLHLVKGTEMCWDKPSSWIYSTAFPYTFLWMLSLKYLLLLKLFWLLIFFCCCFCSSSIVKKKVDLHPVTSIVTTTSAANQMKNFIILKK